MVEAEISRLSLCAAAEGGLGGPARGQPDRAQPARAWPGGAKAAVSLTYDDALNSQLDNAVPELKRLGMKGTFFLTENNAHWRLADWEALARDGHEGAHHTLTHPRALSGHTAEPFPRRGIS